jgi:hypothetical protein
VTIPAEVCKIRASDQVDIRIAQPPGADAVNLDTTINHPVSAVDPFSRAFLRDPYPHHEAGPVVWLEQRTLPLRIVPV